MTFMGDTVDISDASDIQFRFVQEEHAGGFCNCWDIDNLMLMNGPANATLGYAVEWPSSQCHADVCSNIPDLQQIGLQ